MEYRTLGRTGISVSHLGLGGLFVSKVGGEYDQGKAAIDRALSLGINYIDTAPGYSNSEEVLGKALADVNQPLVMSTKLGGRPDPFDPKNAAALKQSIDDSLTLLGRDVIDVLMIHEPERPGQHDWWDDFDAVQGPVLNVLDEAKAAGKIRYTGLGGTTTSYLAHQIRTGMFDVVLTAFNSSMLWREAELEVIPAAVEQGMGIVSGSPLQQGALAQRYDDVIDEGRPWLSKPRRDQYRELYRFLDELNMPVAELAMRFVLSNPHIHSVLTGVRSVEEVDLNVAAEAKGPLSPGVLQRLDDIYAICPMRPCEEPFGLPFRWTARGPGRAGR